MKENERYDYIVVGGGSAGCVVAGLLAERSSARILLLEAGPEDKGLFIRMPAGFPEIVGKLIWPYQSDAEPNMRNRAMAIPQGRVLGGGSSVNGQLYVRGHAQDYDDWETEYGCTGWGYRDVLPYFIKSESNQSLHNPYHGVSGHLKVSDSGYRHPLSYAMVKAGQELGYPYVNDFNGASQQGVGFYQTTTYRGQRCSTSVAYLAPVRHQSNIEVLTGVMVERLLLDQDRATGVEFTDAGGKRRQVQAKREIVLCAGAIGTPKLLMLSGIGPAEHLREVGIKPRVDSPWVGQRLQDHLHFSVIASLRDPISLLGQDKGLKALANGLEWLLFKRGVCASNLLECGGFFATGDDDRPDVQLMGLAASDNVDDKGKQAQSQHALSLKLAHLRPRARGEVRLRDSHPHSLPQISLNYLAAPEDVAAQVRAVRLGLQLFQAPTLAALIDQVLLPTPNLNSDVQLAAFVREHGKTEYHPTGTCCMGADPATSVVDLQLRLRGVAGVRIADASVFPCIPAGNTNAPTIMVAERAVDLILATFEEQKHA
ncbi:GMC family oxidoreductase [Serratia proteamaculans]|uniref:GMC family oxidoreductase n=1 Tax=Serratia proteamaculans TaxID=28151 RepID=UPI0039BDFFCF